MKITRVFAALLTALIIALPSSGQAQLINGAGVFHADGVLTNDSACTKIAKMLDVADCATFRTQIAGFGGGDHAPATFTNNDTSVTCTATGTDNQTFECVTTAGAVPFAPTAPWPATITNVQDALDWLLQNGRSAVRCNGVVLEHAPDGSAYAPIALGGSGTNAICSSAFGMAPGVGASIVNGEFRCAADGDLAVYNATTQVWDCGPDDDVDGVIHATTNAATNNLDGIAYTTQVTEPGGGATSTPRNLPHSTDAGLVGTEVGLEGLATNATCEEVDLGTDSRRYIDALCHHGYHDPKNVKGFDVNPTGALVDAITTIHIETLVGPGTYATTFSCNWFVGTTTTSVGPNYTPAVFISITAPGMGPKEDSLPLGIQNGDPVGTQTRYRSNSSVTMLAIEVPAGGTANVAYKVEITDIALNRFNRCEVDVTRTSGRIN